MTEENKLRAANIDPEKYYKGQQTFIRWEKNVSLLSAVSRTLFALEKAELEGVDATFEAEPVHELGSARYSLSSLIKKLQGDIDDPEQVNARYYYTHADDV